ncbi:uncharacterized protein LY79DRAFT_208470 [Colletotrichum navitas]|uniref:Uncharacterized protein n=1 Tax=Colletotrichum navitas TaxID=681940 RepID=A0AAD8VBL0_9PEZI|nr:uncharacterized protein LY79DRAFT_208470 [Colletotrichum navitas]KAK1599106.1 hypothetical protein LY79DRAFT_208470 [Colletotrichum navitas]
MPVRYQYAVVLNLPTYIGSNTEYPRKSPTSLLPAVQCHGIRNPRIRTALKHGFPFCRFPLGHISRPLNPFSSLPSKPLPRAEWLACACLLLLLLHASVTLSSSIPRRCPVPCVMHCILSSSDPLSPGPPAPSQPSVHLLARVFTSSWVV